MSKLYFWSLSLTKSSIAACLWSREEEETAVLAFSSRTLYEEGGDVPGAVDAALSEITPLIPEEAGEPTKTVFGVPNSWIADGNIKKDHLTVMRDICGTLSLSPVGFVILSEAIAHEIKHTEGTPLTAVVIYLGVSNIEVTLFRLGNLAGTVDVGRSVSLPEDVVEALSRFAGIDPLPSRFLIFGGQDSELNEASSVLSSADWKSLLGDKVSLLHDPKVEVIDTHHELAAISIAGSSEMGPVTSFVLPSVAEPSIDPTHANVENTDQLPEDLGFVMDQDIAHISPKMDLSSVYEEEPTESFEEDPVHTVTPNSRFIKKRRLSGIFVSPLLKIKTLFKKQHKHPGMAPFPGDTAHIHRVERMDWKRTGTIVGIVAALLFAAFLFLWYSIPKAEVTIFISPRTLTSRETFTLREDITEVDVAGRQLPVQKLTKTISDESSGQASGSKTVGERAKGVVTIRNGTSSDIKLPSGAQLVGPNDLKFNISEAASVSAAVSPTSPGSVTIAAVAAAIGAEYNLASNESLKVGNFSKSEIDAVVSESFSGGSSRQITAVARADMDSLEKTLTESLTDRAKEEMTSEVPDGYVFIPDSVTTKVTSKSFDRKVGDESDNVKLELSLEVVAYAIPKVALDSISQSLLSEQVPSGFVFRPEQTEASFSYQKGATTQAISLGLTANLLPNVDPDEVSKKVRGKKLSGAEEYLSSIPGFVRAAITLSPSFPGPFKTLPWKVTNISVSVEAER